jgi:heme exporter protein D
MPLLQNQAESHVVAAESEDRGAAEVRPVVALAFTAGVLIPGSIAVVEHGVATWIAVAVTVCVAATALHRLRKERALLNGRTTTIATVTHWEKAEDSEGGYFYSVQYCFRGSDGKEYIGKATSQVELPTVGEMLSDFIYVRRPDPELTACDVLVLPVYLHRLRQVDDLKTWSQPLKSGFSAHLCFLS